MRLVFRPQWDFDIDVEHIICRIEEMGSQGLREVCLDMGEFQTPTSAFLSQLLRLHMFLQRRQIVLCLDNLHPMAHAVIEHSSIGRLLEAAQSRVD